MIKMNLKFDIHIHSNHSYDSFIKPEEIIKHAKKRGLSGIAVTDHETISGGIETKRANKDSKFLVIVGAEYHTEFGDIIGLFLKKEIKTRDPFEIINEIKKQNGISLFAHPARTFYLPRFGKGKEKNIPSRLLKKIDLIEGYNMQTRKEQNLKAVSLAQHYNKPMTSGSDAHFAREVGNGAMEINIKSNTEEEVKKALLEGNFIPKDKFPFMANAPYYFGTFFAKHYKRLAKKLIRQK